MHAQSTIGTSKKDRGEESKYHRALGGRALSRQDKGHIAEAAILFRLALHGYRPHGPVFDGEKSDWIVEIPETGRLRRLQVRWAAPGIHGLPYIRLRCSDGRGRFRRYNEGEFDFIVGYDLFTDTAFIYSWLDVQGNKAAVTMHPAFAERWEKLRET